MSTFPFSTRQRILAAAEELFAEHGFAGASLRRVTAAAKVNLAAVNYHFGSKEKLIEEVFRRRLDVLTEQRMQGLTKIANNQASTLEDLLDAFIRPALDLSLSDRGGAAFMRVMARAYAEQDDTFRAFLSTHYGHVLKQFAAEFARMLPALDKEELYWRLDLVAGALTYTMADFGVIRSNQVDTPAHRQRAADHLIRFGAAGLRAP